MSADTLYFQSTEQAERFALRVEEAGHEAMRFFDGDFSVDCGYRYGVTYSGPEVTHHSESPYSAAGRKASRFRDDRD